METTTWTHPTTGQIRHYIDGQYVLDLMGAEDAYGFGYSGADMDRVLAAKWWLDEDGALHIDRLSERGRIDAAHIRSLVEAQIAADAAAEAEDVEEVPAETVRTECPACGRRIAVRRDGRLYVHGPRAARCPGEEPEALDVDDVIEDEAEALIVGLASADDFEYVGRSRDALARAFGLDDEVEESEVDPEAAEAAREYEQVALDDVREGDIVTLRSTRVDAEITARASGVTRSMSTAGEVEETTISLDLGPMAGLSWGTRWIVIDSDSPWQLASAKRRAPGSAESD